MQTIREMCRLKREIYPDFSIRHFYEHLTERQGGRHVIHVYALLASPVHSGAKPGIWCTEGTPRCGISAALIAHC